MIRKYFYAITFALLAVSGPALAGGASYAGSVSVYTSGNWTYMIGTMNVRYNEKASGSPFVAAAGDIGSNISFFGKSSNNTNFSCYVAPDDPQYDEAVDIKNNLKNGSRLIAYMDTDVIFSKCVYVGLGNYSYYLD